MIAFLSGTIRYTAPQFIVLDVAGVGYKVHCNQSTLSNTAPNTPLSLFTHLVVREDAMELFGFREQNELQLFELLIGISGVGPRSALGILGLDNVPALANAIANSNIGYLTSVSGVGKKSAEKIVLELREKVSHLTTADGSAYTEEEDVVEALIALGYAKQAVRDVLKTLPPEMTEQGERIKAALQRL